LSGDSGGPEVENRPNADDLFPAIPSTARSPMTIHPRLDLRVHALELSRPPL
jgi:hypothetical protein